MFWQLNYPWLSVTILQALGHVACFALPATGQEVERRTLAGERVVIHNLVGDLRVEPGPGPNIVVAVTRGGKDSGELRIESGDLEGRETLRVIYPEDEIVYARLGRNSEVTLQVRDDGNLMGRSSARAARDDPRRWTRARGVRRSSGAGPRRQEGGRSPGGRSDDGG